MLSGEAKHWWVITKMVMEEEGEVVTWSGFKKKFLEEYFLDSVRKAKELKFLELVQGSMSMAKYNEKFKHLSRFYTLSTNEV